MNLKEFLHYFDFDYHKENGEEGEEVYKLDDLQGANLGGIEGDEFHGIVGILDRLDIYYEDYIMRGLEERGFEGGDYPSALEWLRKNGEQDEDVIELLEYITLEKELRE